MAVSAPSHTKLLSGLLGVSAFWAAQVPLVLSTPAVAGGINAPGWFLNSGQNALLVGSIVAAGATLLYVRKLATVRDAVFYGIGAVMTMIATLVAIGPGSLFPIVVAFGMCVIALAVLVGATCGAGVRALRAYAG
jgi:hypothetical protein